MENIDAFVNKFSGYSESYWFYDNTVELLYDKTKHEYNLVTGDGLEPQPSVTTIVKKAVDKSEILIPWGCKVMGNKMKSLVSFPVTLSELEFDNLVQTSKGAHREHLEEAGMVGNMAHNWIEGYIKQALGLIPSVPPMPSDPRASQACNAALDWMQKHNVRWKSTETKIYSRIHKYAGTMDGLAYTDSCYDPLCCPKEYNDRLSLIDWKTSNNLRLDYLFQVSGYYLAYTEENPDANIEDGWVIRLGKEDGEFDPWHIEDVDEFEMYAYGFICARKWYGSMELAKEQVKIKNETLRDARKAVREQEKQAALKIKCKGSDRYKGMRKPACNGGEPCEYCLNKYEEESLKRSLPLDTGSNL